MAEHFLDELPPEHRPEPLAPWRRWFYLWIGVAGVATLVAIVLVLQEIERRQELMRRFGRIPTEEELRAYEELRRAPAEAPARPPPSAP